MFSPLSLPSSLPPPHLQLLLLLCFLPSLLKNALSSFASRTTSAALRAEALVAKGEADLAALRRDPALSKNFVMLSKLERALISATKARDDLAAARAAKAEKMNKYLTPFELAAYFLLAAFMYDKHILVISDEADAARPGSYLKSLTFPASFFLSTISRATAMELPELGGGGGGWGSSPWCTPSGR